MAAQAEHRSDLERIAMEYANQAADFRRIARDLEEKAATLQRIIDAARDAEHAVNRHGAFEAVMSAITADRRHADE